MRQPRRDLAVKRAAQATIAAASPEIRSLSDVLLARYDLATIANRTFRGRRDVNHALGYLERILPRHYWSRYLRGGVAKRLVEAFPSSTWRGGGELVEDENPDVDTAFETAFFELNQRLGIWSTFLKADILAGLGRFSIIFLGAPDDWSTPLPKGLNADSLAYLSVKSERDVQIPQYVTDRQNPRFGQPEFYGLTAVNINGQQLTSASRVHWSRVIHVAEGVLDNPVFGTPRLQGVWNYLDDLDKVVGGGAEASWKRIDGGKQFNLDGSMPPPDTAQLQELSEQIELYTNDLQRIMKTRGLEIKDLGADVSTFSQNADTIISLISATTGIPQRILMGSERGQLASNTDQSNYDDRVQDRRNEFATSNVVRPFIDRLIEHGILPAPKQYDPRWPEVDDLDDLDRMSLAEKAARVNQIQGETVITANEIRDKILGWEPLDESELDAAEVEVEEDDSDETTLIAAAARSPKKKLRLLRLTPKGRKQLRQMKKAKEVAA